MPKLTLTVSDELLLKLKMAAIQNRARLGSYCVWMLDEHTPRFRLVKSGELKLVEDSKETGN